MRVWGLGLRVQDLGFRGSGVKGFRGSGVQGFRSSGVQGFRQSARIPYLSKMVDIGTEAKFDEVKGQK